MNLAALRRQLRKLANPRRAALSLRFFKTGPGQYGEGDKFLGLTVPAARGLAKKFWQEITWDEMEALLRSPWHDERAIALFILIHRYQKGDERARSRVYRMYLRSTRHINNWDLVDSSAEHVVGAYLSDKPRDILYRLVKSPSLWERRIAMLATFHYIKQGDFADALAIAELLLDDTHDLIHKAVGWMLREIGKRGGRAFLERFLRRHGARMPRTMLRYAIEHFSPAERARYLRRRTAVKK